MLTAADTGGTWSGSGIVDPQQGLFDPSDAGLGTHTVYYSIDGLNACDASDSTDISVLDAPTADFGWTNNGLTVQFSDSSSTVSGYAWEFGDGSTSTDQNPTNTYAKDSIYEACLMVFDSNGCTDTACYMVDLTDVPVREYEKGTPGFSLRPNPASQRVELRFSQNALEQNIRSIELLNFQGKVLREKGPNGGSISLSVSELAPGPYFLRVISEEGTAQRKFIVR